MFKHITISLILYTIIVVNIKAMVFISFYEHERISNNSDTEPIKVKNSTNNTGKSRERMFGIDTGNSETDFEAGMWLFALLGTLAAAIPVAFLSPNLGFKKRSVNENRPFDIFTENLNQTIIVNTTIENGFNFFD